MKTGPFTVEKVNTSHDAQYNVTNRRDGTIYATIYDFQAAEICYKALNKSFLAI